MTRRNFLTLAGVALLLLVAGIWLSAHRAAQQQDRGGGKVFADLTAALGDVGEVRLSRGDGSRTTLRKDAAGWSVVERQYPADPARVRELVLALANLQIVELKTSAPANYAKLGVEAPDSPTATGTLVEVVAGENTWPLIVGKSAGARAVYVRRPNEAASALAQPAVSADPDQKRWLDRQLTDIPAAQLHDIRVTPAKGPAYTLTRATRDATDLVLSPVPRGRKPLGGLSLAAQAEALTAFSVDDVRAAAESAPATDTVTFRTFDGEVIEFAGRRANEKGYIKVATRRDAELAARFPPPADQPAPAVPTEPAAKPAARTLERLAQRASGIEYEIPLYKYDALFKPQEELLESASP